MQPHGQPHGQLRLPSWPASPASADHWISAWSPPGYPLPVKLLPANASSGPAHELTFELLNVRHPVQFRLTAGRPTPADRIAAGHHTGDGPAAVVIASSNLVLPGKLPMQLRTSATSVPGTLRVTWVDTVISSPAGLTWRYVGAGTSTTTAAADAQTTTYTRADLAACSTKDGTATSTLDVKHGSS